MDQDNAIDEIETSHVVKDFAYGGNERERSAWKFCNNFNIFRSEVVFFVKIFVIFSLITLRKIKLIFSSSNFEEISVWISILSGLDVYLIHNHKL